jgi:hypothetical protein
MTAPVDPAGLADWRRRVAEIYAAVRRASRVDPQEAWESFRAARDALFATHPHSALNPAQRRRFNGLPYYEYDPAWRVVGTLNTAVERENFRLDLDVDGEFLFTRVGRIHFAVKGVAASLNLYWIEGYGGGLFLPFRDRSNGQGSYGGGRYLYDTIKGADPGAVADGLILDFNFAYNPSCAYNSRWSCPLPPAENRLPFSVEAGEKAFASLI